MEAKERLYLTEDGHVVAEGDAAARWLHAAVGQKIVDAAKYGIVDGLAPRPDPKPDPKPEAKKRSGKK